MYKKFVKKKQQRDPAAEMSCCYVSWSLVYVPCLIGCTSADMACAAFCKAYNCISEYDQKTAYYENYAKLYDYFHCGCPVLTGRNVLEFVYHHFISKCCPFPKRYRSLIIMSVLRTKKKQLKAALYINRIINADYYPHCAPANRMAINGRYFSLRRYRRNCGLLKGLSHQ